MTLETTAMRNSIIRFLQPPSDFQKEPTVDGAAIRTKSQVPFGDEVQNRDFYRTTNQDVYVPQNGQAATNVSSQGASSIPLDYYPGNYRNARTDQLLTPGTFDLNNWNAVIGSMRGTTTQKTDFTNPEQGRHMLNEQALNRVSVNYHHNFS